MALASKAKLDVHERLRRKIDEQRALVEEDRRNGFDAAKALDDFVRKNFDVEVLISVIEDVENGVDEELCGWQPD